MIALTASALCRKVVESSGEWLVKICQRHPATQDSKACSILVNYGCGYATLVLLDGAELDDLESSSPSQQQQQSNWKLQHLPTIWVSAAVVASVVKSSGNWTSDHEEERRVKEYGGIVPADDASKLPWCTVYLDLLLHAIPLVRPDWIHLSHHLSFLTFAHPVSL
jgi:hypothetical protein